MAVKRKSTEPTHIYKLSRMSTTAPEHLSKPAIKAEIKELIERIREQHSMMYAQEKYSLLIVLQGMDASGKDGAIRRISRAINPLGMQIAAFKKPTEEEFAHDFLWRVHKVVPGRGKVTIFNRSHYEDVLIQRVHKWITPSVVKKRFEHINNFERLISQNDTTILKFYLHVSKEQQLVRLNERKTMLRKMWKHNDNDFVEREHWLAYRRAYEDVFKNCGPEIPWIIVPTDQNWYKEYIILTHIHKALSKMKLAYPRLEEEKK